MKYLLLTILLFSTIFSIYGQDVQPEKITEKYFPNFNHATFNTPAFQKKEEFTNYDEMMVYLEKTLEGKERLGKMEFIGKSQQGKHIPIIYISRPTRAIKARVWFQGGIHGNEPAGTEGLLHLIHELLNNNHYSHLLDLLDIAIVPMANIDGYEIESRKAANDLDLNRDYTKLHSPEIVALLTAFNQFRPHIAVDFHEYRPFRKDFAGFGSGGVTNPNDVMFLNSSNLNIPRVIREFTESDMIGNAEKVLTSHNLTYSKYYRTRKKEDKVYFTMGGTSPRSSSSLYPLTNSISMLMEIRGIGLGRTSFNRRTYSVFLLAASFLETAHQNHERVKGIVRAASKPSRSIIVTSKNEVENSTLKVIDVEKAEMIELEVSLHNRYKIKPTLMRKRPLAYILLPEQKAATEKLKILGLAIKELEKEKTLEVEKYTVTSHEVLPKPFEGIHEAIVKTEITTETKTFPEGSFYIITNQKNSNLLTELLEPEATNGFIRFRVIETNESAELPIYRFME